MTPKPASLRGSLSCIWLLVLGALLCHAACSRPKDPAKEIPSQLVGRFPTNSFASTIGSEEFATEKKDVWDSWYNAQDFTENNHLGEDWNKNSGGNTDCGEPVYAAAEGRIVFARDAGPGWGNVVILDHTAADGTKLQSLYGHLKTLERTEGIVARRERIGTIGDANGKYLCHLHFELRSPECPFWNEPGYGYSSERLGWIDPSEFIETTR